MMEEKSNFKNPIVPVKDRQFLYALCKSYWETKNKVEYSWQHEEQMEALRDFWRVVSRIVNVVELKYTPGYVPMVIKDKYPPQRLSQEQWERIYAGSGKILGRVVKDGVAHDIPLWIDGEPMEALQDEDETPGQGAEE
jgi:hypothetical protein